MECLAYMRIPGARTDSLVSIFGFVNLSKLCELFFLSKVIIFVIIVKFMWCPCRMSTKILIEGLWVCIV